jgi:hypothetical protein
VRGWGFGYKKAKNQQPEPPMKTLLLAAALLLSSKAAFAMHAYASDNCVAMSLEATKVEFELSNGEPASPHRLVPSDDQTDSQWVNLSQKSDSTDMPAKDSALVLKTTSIAKGPSKKIDDGCFQGAAYTYVRTTTVLAVSAAVKEKLQLSVGESLVFSCYTDHQAPTGKNCGQ